MRILSGSVDVDIRQWRSKEELKTFIGTRRGGLLLGTSAEQGTEFYSARFVGEDGGPSEYVVGVCNEGLGVNPQLLIVPDTGLCLFGLNSEVVCVSFRKRSMEYHLPLGCLFRTMIPLFGRDLILAVYEFGVKAIRASGGAEVWDVARDVVERVGVADDTVRIQFMDSAPITVDVATGVAVSTQPSR